MLASQHTRHIHAKCDTEQKSTVLRYRRLLKHKINIEVYIQNYLCFAVCIDSDWAFSFSAFAAWRVTSLPAAGYFLGSDREAYHHHALERRGVY